jgi:hypothetical protein
MVAAVMDELPLVPTSTDSKCFKFVRYNLNHTTAMFVTVHILKHLSHKSCSKILQFTSKKDFTSLLLMVHLLFP